MSHGQNMFFSSRGISICVEFFKRRGHGDITAFVPQYRKKAGQARGRNILDKLERDRVLVYTPSREVDGRRITPYDDRYIVEYAVEHGGVIVSGDQFRDLKFKAEWAEAINTRLLEPIFVRDTIMFPD